MDRLPGELLVLIFEKLYFCEKEQCLLVCPLWANILKSTLFFDTFHINENYTLDILDLLLRKKPAYKDQIKTLVIHSDLPEEKLPPCLQNYFPNLHSLYIRGQNTSTFAGKNTFLLNAPKLQYLEQHYCNSLEDSFLYLQKCNALKTLVLKGLTRGVGDLRLLANAPNITSLMLGNTRISLKELETIHSYLMALESLELECIDIIDVVEDEANPSEPSVIPEYVVPSASTTKLSIISRCLDTSRGSSRRELKWLRYIRHKYINLLEFRFLAKLNGGEEVFTNEIFPLIKSMGSKTKLLEIKCLTTLPSLLQHMKVAGLPTQCLNASVCCIRASIYVSGLEDTHNFIRELTLTSISNSCVLKSLKNLHSLKVLSIKGYHNTIALEYILTTHLSLLESLSIDYFELHSLAPLVKHVHCLKRLMISETTISPPAYAFISLFLPYLRHLELCLPYVRDGRIQFNGLHLYSLHLRLSVCTFLEVKTDNDGKSRYFLAESNFDSKNDGNPDLWDTLHQIGFSGTTSRKMVHFEFGSFQLLYINYMVAR